MPWHSVCENFSGPLRSMLQGSDPDRFDPETSALTMRPSDLHYIKLLCNRKV